MAGQEEGKPKYKWTNRADYSNNTPVQETGDKTLDGLSSEESQRVRKLFELVNTRS